MKKNLISIKKLILLIVYPLFCIASSKGHVPFDIIYHGSPELFEKVEPRPNLKKDGKNQVLWEGTAIFGAFDKRIALFYTHTRTEGVIAEIDLHASIERNDPILFLIKGGETMEKALDALWGSKSDDTSATGFIYLLDGRHFVSEPGLGNMERVCRHPECNIGRVPIHRRKELEHYRELGLIEVKWVSIP